MISNKNGDEKLHTAYILKVTTSKHFYSTWQEILHIVLHSLLYLQKWQDTRAFRAGCLCAVIFYVDSSNLAVFYNHGISKI